MNDRKFVAVMDAKERSVPNVFLRDGKFYVCVKFKGKRFIRLLPHQTKTEAINEARRFVRAVRAGVWDEVEKCRTREEIPLANVGEVCDAHKAAAAARNFPRPRTVQNNILALEMVVKLGLGVSGARSTSTLALTEALAGKFAAAFVRGVAPEKLESRRRSVLSYLRQARSVFAVGSDFAALRLPDTLMAFRKARPVKAEKYRYRMPAPALYEPTIAAARALDPAAPLLAAWLLTYELGLRAGEAMAVEWDWFEVGRRLGHSTEHWLHVCNRPGFKVKGREGYVPVPARVWEALQAVRVVGREHVLPGKHATDRHNLVERQFSEWMRDLGWTTTDKAAHELRKLRGSFWRGKYGLEMAHEWLRHSSYQTTLDYYAGMPTREEPLSLDEDGAAPSLAVLAGS